MGSQYQLVNGVIALLRPGRILETYKRAKTIVRLLSYNFKREWISSLRCFGKGKTSLFTGPWSAAIGQSRMASPAHGWKQDHIRMESFSSKFCILHLLFDSRIPHYTLWFNKICLFNWKNFIGSYSFLPSWRFVMT